MIFRQTVTVSYALILTWTADLNTDVTDKECDHIHSIGTLVQSDVI